MIKKILITLKKYGIKGLLKKTYLYYDEEDKKEYYKWIKVIKENMYLIIIQKSVL